MVGPRLSRNFFLNKYSSLNRPTMALIFRGTSRLYTLCILFVYSLLKVVRHYDLSVLSMNVMDRGVGWWVSSNQFYFLFLEVGKP